jgi:hypothetical protein
MKIYSIINLKKINIKDFYSKFANNLLILFLNILKNIIFIHLYNLISLFLGVAIIFAFIGFIALGPLYSIFLTLLIMFGKKYIII